VPLTLPAQEVVALPEAAQPQIQRAQRRIEALRGRTEPALAALEDALRLGWRRGWWLAQDPALESLRGQPRFTQLLARMKESNQHQRQRLQQG